MTRKPTRRRVSGACPIRRSRDEMAVIRQTIIDVIEDDPPMTVRQVFYQLVSRGVIEKTEMQYQKTVIRLMTEMRLAGDLRYDWVVSMRAAGFASPRPSTTYRTPSSTPRSSTVAARSAVRRA